MPNQSIQTDILIVGSGAAGLFAALQIPAEKHVLLITKKEAEQSDSFLAQGGIACCGIYPTTKAIIRIH